MIGCHKYPYYLVKKIYPTFYPPKIKVKFLNYSCTRAKPEIFKMLKYPTFPRKSKL